MNIVIDVNIWIGFLFGKSVNESLKIVTNNSSINIFISKPLINEFNKVVEYPKIKKYVKSKHIRTINELFVERCIEYSPHSIIDICRDPNDNFLLSLCKDANIDFLITGDNDLLVLNPFEKTKILSLAEFVQLI